MNYSIEKLIKSFPRKLESEVEKVLKIIDSNYKYSTYEGQNEKLDNFISNEFQFLKIENEILEIPIRIYFDEPKLQLEENLTEDQKIILNCIFLRHHNGYIREERLKKLANKNEYWIYTFVFQLIGEYVYEILEYINLNLSEEKLYFFTKIATENPKYFQLIENRMISYWNEYHRRKFPKLSSYVGFIIIEKIKKNVA